MTTSDKPTATAEAISAASVIRSPSLLIASWFLSGLAPVAPGTAGSLAALPLVAAVLHMLPLPWTVALVVLLFGLGVWSASEAGRRWGKVDHGAIVIDEVVGQLIAVAIPFYLLGDAILSLPEALFFGFVAFRLFDIVKVWPADYFDVHSKNGWGVMLDDVFAGIWAGIVVVILGLALY
jgi:phosphatidylglycerophosphatase A